ncbi:YceD family protein [Lentibacillus saliphilus]|uniref:YceD family protein n=1 Tax=Lentibacillus saliphilus TaxID=2737028 RepID=UPI001C2FB219
MKFTLGQIRKNAFNEPMTFDQKVDVSDLQTMDNDIRKIDFVSVYGTCSYQGDEIVFSFNIKGEMILPCARTLTDVVYPFEIKANEVFSTSLYYSEEDAENDVHPVEGETLDLAPIIKEIILLNVPFRVFSNQANSEDNVPVEGEGWAFVSEEKLEETVDPRLQKLQSFFKDKPE